MFYKKNEQFYKIKFVWLPNTLIRTTNIAIANNQD